MPPLCKGRWHGEAVTEGLLYHPPTKNRKKMLYEKGKLNLPRTTAFLRFKAYIYYAFIKVNPPAGDLLFQ